MGTTADGGKGSEGRAANGDRPVGAASCRRDHYTMASCQPPPPPAAENPTSPVIWCMGGGGASYLPRSVGMDTFVPNRKSTEMKKNIRVVLLCKSGIPPSFRLTSRCVPCGPPGPRYSSVKQVAARRPSPLSRIRQTSRPALSSCCSRCLHKVNVDKVTTRQVPLQTIVSFAKRICCGLHSETAPEHFSSLYSSANLMQSLGSTTVVCCVDKEVMPVPRPRPMPIRRQCPCPRPSCPNDRRRLRANPPSVQCRPPPVNEPCPQYLGPSFVKNKRGGGGGSGLRERGNDTSQSTGRSGRQNAATPRNMRREERVTVQGPVKEQQPDGMSHGGGGIFVPKHSPAAVS